MFKLIISLLWNRASKKQWQIQIGAYLLRRGSGIELGKVISEQKLSHKRFNVKRTIGLTFHFGTNQIMPLTERQNVRLK